MVGRGRGERVPERARNEEASGASVVRDCGSSTDRVADHALQAFVVRRRTHGAVIDGDRDRDPGRRHARATLRNFEGSRGIIEDYDCNAVRCVQNNPVLRRESFQRYRQRGFELRAQPVLARPPAGARNSVIWQI